MVQRGLAVVAIAVAGLGVVAATGAGPDLTGFGATRVVFAAHHQPDTNPKRIPGATFGPVEADGGDHIVSVFYEKGRVERFEIHYAPPVALALAETELARELPQDAKLVYRVTKPATCELRQYRSLVLARIEGPFKVSQKQKKFVALFGKGVPGLIDVSLYSSETAPYNGNTVEGIVLQAGYNAQDKRNGC